MRGSSLEMNGVQKANGTYAANESLLIKGETYYFHADAWMARDWQMVDGSWHYYYTESGAMAKSRWIQTNGYGIM